MSSTAAKSAEAEGPSVCSDDGLLEAIAQRRDKEAFGLFYERYERQAFGLAYHITANHEQATEAVQDAMVRVWNSASLYKSGNAKAWLLKIVAREALGHHKNRSLRKRTMNELPSNIPAEQPAPTETLMAEEVKAACRRFLGDLPDLDRRLVALVYGAGMSQAEAGEALGMPPRTVSARIEKTLQSVRQKLTVAGFAALAPLALEHLTAEAICSSTTALRPSVETLLPLLDKGTGAGHIALREVSRQMISPVGLSVVWPLAAALVLASAGTYWFVSTLRSEPPVPPIEAPQAPAAPAMVPVASPKPLLARWDLRKGPPADIKVLAGSWNWQGAPAVAKGMFAQAATIMLPSKMPATPVRLKLFSVGRSDKATVLGVSRTDGENLARKRKRITTVSTYSLGEPYYGFSTEYFFCGRYLVVEDAKGQFVIGRELDVLDGHDYPWIFLNESVLQEIEIQALNESDLPPSVKEALKHVDEFRKNSVEQQPCSAAALK